MLFQKEAEIRSCIGTGLPYASYEFTGRIRVCLGGICLPYAKKSSLLGRFYTWAGDALWRWYIWRAGKR